MTELPAVHFRREPRDADEEVGAAEAGSEEHLHQVRRRRRGLQARALAPLRGEVLGEVRRADVWQRGDLDLVHVALHNAGGECVHVDRERSGAVQRVGVVDAAEELLDRSRLFTELSDLLQRPPYVGQPCCVHEPPS